MSTVPTEFYDEILAWIEEGTPIHKFFSGQFGLCSSFANWNAEHGGEFSAAPLKEEFKAAGLDADFPFGGLYFAESFADKLYSNPDRLAWIRAHSSKGAVD